VNETELLFQKMRAWREDPVLFAREVFNFEPTEQQAQVMRAFAKPGAKVCVKAGHGVGKSALMAILAVWHVLLFTDSKSAATAPTAQQLRDVLMSEVGKQLQAAHPMIREQLNFSNMRLSVKGKETTQFLTARTARPEEPTALQGFHAKSMAFFIDEAFGVADPIFEVARGALSTEGARVLMCGNPTATSGYAFNAFHRNKHLWSCFTLSCVDSPLVSKSYIEEMKTEFGDGSDVYKVRVLGEFPSAAITQLIPRTLAEVGATRRIHPMQYDFAPVILGVDVAWEGDDRSAVYLRQGLAARKLGEWRNISNMDLGGLIDQFWREHGAHACFIDVGWGTGVIDYLRSIGRNPIPVNFGGKSISDRYANKRTEMWCEMKKWLEDGGAFGNEKDLIEDLVGPEYFFQPNGKIMLEAKKDMKKRGLCSPDLGDALALTFAAPVYKPTEIEMLSGTVGKVQTEYKLFD
jgi:hypothetical protein